MESVRSVKKVMAASVYVYGVKAKCRKPARVSFQLAAVELHEFDQSHSESIAIQAVRKGMKTIDLRTKVILAMHEETTEDYGTYTTRSFGIGQGRSVDITRFFPELVAAQMVQS